MAISTVRTWGPFEGVEEPVSQMIAYHCRGPEGTRLERVHLRVVIYTPRVCPPDRLKCVVQAVQGRTPLAADPLWIGYLPPLGMAKLISDSLGEGWRFEFDHTLARTVDRQQMSALKERAARRVQSSRKAPIS